MGAPLVGLNKKEAYKISQLFVHDSLDHVSAKLSKAFGLLQKIEKSRGKLNVPYPNDNYVFLTQTHNSAWTGVYELGNNNRRPHAVFSDERAIKLSKIMKARVLNFFQESVSDTLGYCITENGRIVEHVSYEMDCNDMDPETGPTEWKMNVTSKLVNFSVAQVKLPIHKFMDARFRELEIYAPQLPMYRVENFNVSFEHKPTIKRTVLLVLKESVAGPLFSAVEQKILDNLMSTISKKRQA